MATLGTIISWIVFGLVIGLIARMLYPGRQSMGFFATMLLGIAGSLVGGFISWAMGFRPEEGAFRGAGWIMSIVGALIVVWLGLAASTRGSAGRLT
ncbi:GlsB/YeaQ/YmgE family stress response membrane protein [Anatilimnocola floriformis]|uniref:GlsB/YeaQ/YmgE family stress response membrane protein n=1 Tax=Anatilimnocola floriformis TaxID=2948575 RepID=UPI0020C2F353|nr:GlsB/YeaQ/YmgE family stress response membrane protein [Anatilimnocola floriformis]